ncbi:MAG TPA: hypothetical protein VI248_23345 [Kineosporiaceae bacterium]
MSCELSIAELDAECAELLPTREALALVNVTIGNITNIVGINNAIAISAFSPGSSTGAIAGQQLGAVSGFFH